MSPRVAIFGAGNIARNHAPRWRRVGADPCCVIDIDEERAAAFAHELQIPETFGQWDEAFRRANATIADICLPHSLHHTATLAAASAGLNVLVEKPMATSLREADEMIEACRRAGVVLMVRHNQRFAPDRRRIKELIDQGMLGRIYLARSWWIQGPTYITTRPWYGRREVGHGGVLLGLGIHHLDLFRWMLGDVSRVSALGNNLVIGPRGMDAEDTVVSIFEFASGAVGEMMMTNGDAIDSYRDDAQRLEFHGSEGWVSTRGGLHGVLPRLFNDQNVHPLDGSVVQEDEFAMMVRCSRDHQPPLTDGTAIRGTIELAVAAYQAMETKTVVALPIAEK